MLALAGKFYSDPIAQCGNNTNTLKVCIKFKFLREKKLKIVFGRDEFYLEKSFDSFDDIARIGSSRSSRMKQSL